MKEIMTWGSMDDFGLNSWVKTCVTETGQSTQRVEERYVLEEEGICAKDLNLSPWNPRECSLGERSEA